MENITETPTRLDTTEAKFVLASTFHALRRAQGALDEKDYKTYKEVLHSVETMVALLRMGYVNELLGTD